MKMNCGYVNNSLLIFNVFQKQSIYIKKDINIQAFLIVHESSKHDFTELNKFEYNFLTIFIITQYS